MKRTRADRRRQQKRKTQRKLKKRQLGGQPNNRRGLALAMASSLSNNRMRRQRQCNHPDYCPEGGKHEFEQSDVREWTCMKCGCTLPYKPSVRENKYASSARAERAERAEKKENNDKKEKEEKEKKEKKEKEEKEEKEKKERKRELKEAKEDQCTIM